ncbi:MAG: threonine--tRNA ligase, partial [Phycisphaerae bacterium]
QPVYSPNIGRLELYRTSGHFPYYKEGNFPPMFERPGSSALQAVGDLLSDPSYQSASERERSDRLNATLGPLGELLGLRLDPSDFTDDLPERIQAALAREEGHLLKPMNCPHHIRIYASEPRSYRDLPVRLAEFGTVYRYEQSGEVSGLTRVRGFTQDDAHLFCTPDQLQDELAGCLQLTRYVLDGLGLSEYRVRVGLHDPEDPKYIANPEAWSRAEEALRHAAATSGLRATEETGEAAFYGPKIDFVVRDCIGREWQLGTVQVDYNLPERFDLEYTGRDNRQHRPIMIHRAPFGSMERFMGILIEHFEGAFPFWLAPVQAVVASISEKSADYAREIAGGLRGAGFRIELDDSPERIGPKKHRARKMKIPYIAVVGEQEAADRTVNINDRNGRQLDNMSLKMFVTMLVQQNQPHPPDCE